MNIAELHKKVMKEFGITSRNYNHQCFEGSYIYEIVEFVIEQRNKEILKIIDNAFVKIVNQFEDSRRCYEYKEKLKKQLTNSEEREK